MASQPTHPPFTTHVRARTTSPSVKTGLVSAVRRMNNGVGWGRVGNRLGRGFFGGGGALGDLEICGFAEGRREGLMENGCVETCFFPR